MVVKPERVKLKEVWKKGETQFTNWLRDNIDVLSDQIGLDLTSLDSEKPVGQFSADIYAEDQSGCTVVIENQFKKTDHDHLGKIITYLSNLEAKKAIWITSEPRPEHINAINWLNEMSPEDTSFYLVKLETYKIGDSEPGPFFTVIVKPSDEVKQIGEHKKKLSQRHILREEFWSQLLEKAKDRTNLHSNTKPSIYSYISTGAGKTGVSYNYYVTYNSARCEIYLDRGKEYEEPNVNEIRFDELYKVKDEIEKRFGDKLNWEKLEDRRACRISANVSDTLGLKDRDKWDELQNKMIETMIRLEKATRKFIEALD